MKRKLIAIVCVLCTLTALFTPAFSENAEWNLSEMTIEELLALREQVDSMLEEKGYAVYFDIERGTKGEAVSNIQERLTALGYYSGKISGKFDTETQKAFKAFEKANGLDNDGMASREDQTVLFGESAVGKVVLTPQPEATAEVSASDAESEDDVDFDYEGCMRYPEDHVGETYKLKGKVEQTIGSRTDGFQLRFSVLGNSEEIIYVSVNDDPGYNILEGDWLIIDLTMTGTVTYESIWGKEITIPAATAENIELK